MAVYIPTANRQPHLFLSHSSSDKDFVRKLAEDLAVCEVDVWLDEWEIEPGDSVYEAIGDGINSSKYVGLVITQSFINSKWVSAEVESAFAKQMNQGNKVIIPLLLEQVDVPIMLQGKLYISFITDYYHSLSKLAALIHDIDQRTISQAILNMNPQTLKESVDTLAYCGLDPYMIIPKTVFDELSAFDEVEVHDNRLRFQDVDRILQNDAVSKKARFYLHRIWKGNADMHRYVH